MESAIIDKVNKDALLQRASSLANGSPCHFLDNPIQRVDQVILRIYFPNEDKTWAAKIPFDQEFSFYEIAVQPLEFLARQHPGIPAPRVHAYVDVGGPEEGENPVGVAYMLIDWQDGKPMQAWSLSEPPVETRHKVLDQIADLMLEMLSKDAVDGGIRFYGIVRHQSHFFPQ